MLIGTIQLDARFGNVYLPKPIDIDFTFLDQCRYRLFDSEDAVDIPFGPDMFEQWKKLITRQAFQMQLARNYSTQICSGGVSANVTLRPTKNLYSDKKCSVHAPDGEKLFQFDILTDGHISPHEDLNLKIDYLSASVHEAVIEMPSLTTQQHSDLLAGSYHDQH